MTHDVDGGLAEADLALGLEGASALPGVRARARALYAGADRPRALANRTC
ncbi:MAG: hypothetical protein WKF40_11885 [Thermoleophilaceae bacterium]